MPDVPADDSDGGGDADDGDNDDDNDDDDDADDGDDDEEVATVAAGATVVAGEGWFGGAGVVVDLAGRGISNEGEEGGEGELGGEARGPKVGECAEESPSSGAWAGAVVVTGVVGVASVAGVGAGAGSGLMLKARSRASRCDAGLKLSPYNQRGNVGSYDSGQLEQEREKEGPCL